MSVQTRDRWVSFWLALLLGFVYLLTHSWMYHSVDEMSVVSAAKTLLAGDGWHANQMEWEQSWRKSQTMTGLDGNLYLNKRGLAVAALILPWLAAAGLWKTVGAVQLALLTGPLVTALTGVVLYRAARRLEFGVGAAALAVLAWGLGTLAWPYSRTLFTEPTAALGLSLALYGAVTFRRASGGAATGALILAGCGLALLTLAKQANAVVGLPFVAYLAYVVLAERRAELTWKRLAGWVLAFGIPLVIAAAAIVAYNHSAFGTLLTPPLDYREGFTTPIITGLRGLLFSSGKGVLWHVPLTWLALASAFFWRRGKRLPDFLLALGTVLSLLLLYSAWSDWAGGRSWGPRFLATVMPAVALMALPALEGTAFARVAAAGPAGGRGGAAALGRDATARCPDQLHGTGGAGYRRRFDDPAALLDAAAFAAAHVLARRRLVHDRPASGPKGALGCAPGAVGGPAGPGDPRRRGGGRRSSACGRRAQNRGAGRGRPACRGRAGRRPAVGRSGRSALGGSVGGSRGEPRRAGFHGRQSEPGRLGAAGHHPLLRHGRPHLVMAQPRAGPAALRRLAAPGADAAGEYRAAEKWLQPYGRAWLVLEGTAPGAAESTTETWLDGYGYRGNDEWVGTQRAVEYIVAPQVADAAVTPAHIQFAGGPTLTGYAAQRGKAPGQVAVRLLWDAPAPDSLRFSVQAVDQAGKLLEGIDRRPGALLTGGGYEDRVGLAVGTDAYALILRVYDSADGKVLPISGSQDGGKDYVSLPLQEHAP